MRARRFFSVVAGLAASLVALAHPVCGAPLSVKYRTATHVYLDGGRADGLAVGDRLLVKSGKETVAEIEVEFVAEASASCKVVNEARRVSPGDAVSRKLEQARAAADLPAEVAPASGGTAPPTAVSPGAAAAAGGAVAVAGTSSPAAIGRAPWGRVRGGLSLGYYKVVDDTPSAFDFEQRTARFDLTVSEIAGHPLTLTARVRSRRNTRARAFGPSTPRDEGEDRLYELTLRYEPTSGALRVEAGRIGVSRFAGIGYIDGALGEARVSPRLYLGAFAGLRADPSGVEAGGRGPKYGTFARLVPNGRGSRGWEVVVAAVREMAEDAVSREYLSIESRAGWGRRFQLVEMAEIDWNRDWRRAASNGRAFQLSRLLTSLTWRLSPRASAHLSYDSRRNYRYYPNRTLAENIFDDLTRQGLRGGLSVGKGLGWSSTAGGGVRVGDREGKKTYSAHGSLRHGGLLGGRLSAGVDASAYKGAFGDGWMGSARLGRRFQVGHSLDLSYTYSLYRVGIERERRRTQRIRLAGRVEMPRRVSLISDLEYDVGDDIKGPRGSLELGYRF